MATPPPPALRDDDRSRWARMRARPVLTGSVAAAGIAVLAVVLVWFQPQTLLFDTVVDEEFPVVDTTSTGEPDSDDAAADAGAGPADETVDDAEPTDDPEPTDDVEPVDDPGPTGDPEPTDDAEPADDAGSADGAGSMDDAEPMEASTEPIALATGSFVSLNRYTVVGEATTYELPDGTRMLRLEDFESTNGPDLYVYLSAAGADAGDDELDEDAIDLGVLSGNVGNQNYEIPDDVDLEHHDTVVIWCLRFTTAFGAADLTG